MSDSNSHIEFQQETYRSMIQIGTMMIKFCGTVNGGAILALLTFIGLTYLHWPYLPSLAMLIKMVNNLI